TSTSAASTDAAVHDTFDGGLMLTAEAHVATERPSRYLAQVCEHLSQIRTHHDNQMQAHDGAPPRVQHVEWTNTDGVIRFDRGRCTLQVIPSGLSLRVEA